MSNPNTSTHNKDLINWKALSRKLAGNSESIRKNNIPKKYMKDVSALLNCVASWDNEIEE